MKKIFSLLTLALLTLSVGAKVVTIDCTSLYSTNTVVTDEVITVDGITLTFDKNGGTAPQYYTTDGGNLRIYKSNKMTVAAATGYTITKIDFDYSKGMWQQNPSSANVGTIINGDWTGESNTIVFTNNTGDQVRIKSMTVTVLGGETPENKVADPVFNPAGGNFPVGTSQEVTVECATENASITLFKVTEDPNDADEYIDSFFPPTGGGYTQGTFYVTESGTYGAVADKNGMEESDTTLVTFNFYKPTCAKPTFDPANGATFPEGTMMTVTINCATEGATITYTVNDDISEGVAPVSVPVSQTTIITAIASKEGYNNSDEATATYTMVEAPTEGPIFTLVTDINDLAAGDKIIIANSNVDGTAVALAGAQTNNFKGENVIVADGKIQTNKANVITLEGDSESWNLKTANGYIYAPGGGNYLRLIDTLDNAGAGNANAIFTISADTTTIRFLGQGEQKSMRSNPNSGNPIFSCYKETSNVKGPVYIYKTTDEIVEVVAPEFTPAANTTFIGSQEVKITCATTGAEIYYSFDNENWTKYEAPFTIDQSCTVYAYAKLGDAQSTVVSAKYYKANAVANIADALALQEGNVDFQFTGEATVTYQNGQNTWIKDATGYGLIFGTVPEMTTGTVISEGWTAYLTVYYDVPEFASPKNVVASEDVVTVDPVEKSTVTNEDVNMYIIMKGQTLTADQDNDTWLNADSLKFFNKFGIELPAFEEGKTYDVVGIATIFKKNPEVYIISATEVQAPAGLRGDVNLDQQVNIQDVTALINYILSKKADGISLENANCNEDDQINIQDVTTLINYILSKHW